MVISLFAILKKSKVIEDMRKSVALYVAKLERVNGKKEKAKEGSKKETTMKEFNKEIKIPDQRKVKSEKENPYEIDKWMEIENVIQKNKNFIQEYDLEDDNDD